MRRVLFTFALLTLSAPAFAQLTDGFEYPDGPLVGNGGWEIWYSGGNDSTVVSGGTHHGGAKSIELIAGSDSVHRFTINGGQWDCSVWTFIPNGTLNAYFIMMNQYESANNWSVQIRFNADSSDPAGNVVESQFDGATVPIVPDAWVELRLEIDLDANLVNSFYNGTPLGVNLSWTENVSGGGLPQIACVDLYSETNNGFRYDDFSLQPAGGGCTCDGDLDASGGVDISDLALFLSSFGTSGPGIPTPCADIDGNGAVDISDLALFLSAFGSTCP